MIPMRNKKSIITLLFYVLLYGCTKTIDAPIRIAIIPWPGYESIHLAMSLNYINPNQVRLVEQANQTQTFQALRSGTVDAAFTTLDMVFTLIDEKLEVQVVLVMDISSGADVVMVRPEIATLKDIKGKRVGVETVAVGAVMLDAMLTAANLKASEIQLVSVSFNEHLSAYREKKVDAVVTFEPIRSKLLDLGAKIIFDSSRIPGRIVDVLVIRKDILENSNKIEHLKMLIQAHFKALDYFKANPEASSVLLAPFLGVNPNQVPMQFTGISLPGLNENYELLSGESPKLLNTSKELADLMLRHHLLQSQVKIDQIIESKFLPTKTK